MTKQKMQKILKTKTKAKTGEKEAKFQEFVDLGYFFVILGWKRGTFQPQ
jgi:hypothetical protein